MHKDILLDSFLILVAKLPKKSNVRNEGLFICLFICLLAYFEVQSIMTDGITANNQ